MFTLLCKKILATLAEELPFAIVAKDDHIELVCSSCFVSKKDRVLVRCAGCRIIHYCDVECQRKDWVNHKQECKLLLNYAPHIPTWMCRMIARIVLKLRRGDQKQKPAFNGKVYEDLMDHSDEIQKDRIRIFEVTAITPILREYMGANFVPEPDLLLSIYGKISINSFNIGGDTGVGLYIGLSAHNHSCVPDAFVSYDGIKAVLFSPNKHQKYSRDLTISYIRLLRSNKDRKQELLNLYYFECTCSRCSDPTMDFLYNSVYSNCCPDSYCLLDPNTKQLSCNKCGGFSDITVEQAIRANEQINLIAEDIKEKTSWDRNKSNYLEMLIELYKKYAKILAPLNINLLLVIDRLVENAFELGNRALCHQYAPLLLPAYRQYLPVGDADLSQRLMQIATASAYDVPPNKKILKLFEEALAASLASHGPQHPPTAALMQIITLYRCRL